MVLSYTCRRGLLRCSFYRDGQCEKPLIAERVTGKDSCAFFVYINIQPKY